MNYTLKDHCTYPTPCMSNIWPRLLPRSSTTDPMCSSGTSTVAICGHGKKLAIADISHMERPSFFYGNESNNLNCQALKIFILGNIWRQIKSLCQLVNEEEYRHNYLKWFQHFFINLFANDLGWSHHEFVSFSSPEMNGSNVKICTPKKRTSTRLHLHILYQYSNMQGATPANNKCVSSFTIFNFHSQISLKLAIESISQVPASNIFSLKWSINLSAFMITRTWQKILTNTSYALFKQDCELECQKPPWQLAHSWISNHCRSKLDNILPNQCLIKKKYKGQIGIHKDSDFQKNIPHVQQKEKC